VHLTIKPTCSLTLFINGSQQKLKVLHTSFFVGKFFHNYNAAASSTSQNVKKQTKKSEQKTSLLSASLDSIVHFPE